MRLPIAAAFVSLSLAACAAQSSMGGAPLPLYHKLDAACGVLCIDGQQRGSAFLVSPDGWVLTVAHPTMGDAQLSWDSPTLGRLPLSRVAADPAHDMVLLRLPPPPVGKTYPCLPLAAEDPPAGAAIFNFGHPMLRRRMMVAGMFAENGTSFEYLPDLAVFAECRHIAGGTIPGMSGGPWVNAAGEVVGIQSGGISDGGVALDVCWCGPRQALARLVADRCSPMAADLGCVVDSLYEADADVRAHFPADAAGALVRQVQAGSALATAGIKSGDLIESVNGAALSDRDGLLRTVRGMVPGSETKLTVRAPDGKAREVMVRTGRLLPFVRPTFSTAP